MPADDWDTHMLFFLNHGYRVIAHDRRVSFMDHDLGYFDLETRVLERPKSVTYVLGTLCHPCVRAGPFRSGRGEWI